MGLSKEAAFRYGFLARCADEGLTEDQIAHRLEVALEKTAAEPAGLGLFNDLYSTAKNVGSDVLNAPLTALGYVSSMAKPVLGMSALGGAALGIGGAAGLSELTKSEKDVDDIRKEELIYAYGQAAEEARRRADARRKLTQGAAKLGRPRLT